MHENRLLHKIGGHPRSLERLNGDMAPKPGETAQAAMQSAVPKEIIAQGLEFVKNPGGRPTKYKPEMALTVYERLADPKRCWTLKATALLMGINESTFYDWLKVHDDLQYAVAAGRAAQEVNFGSMLLHGFKYSSGVEYILTNLHNWSQKQRTEHALDLNAAIAAQEQKRKAVDWGAGVDQSKNAGNRVIDVGAEVAE